MSNSDANPSAGLHVPDHVLLRRIGRGSSGEVWLARSAVTGAYHAVKIIRRANFPDQAPYLRELKGIRKFEPISRSHPGFVNILQVGQVTEKEYFYYLMELADGATPESNQEKVNTLEQFIREGRRFSVDEVLDLGIRLSDALHCLHEAGLVHRDIKPSNLLFVAGRPKLADIGLVTDAEDAASLVGTPGYIPPEGPGSRQADVYALGKVLYECLTGLDRSRFPDLPTFFDGHPDQEGFLELNEVILKACHQDHRHRYRNARQLHADLIAIENGESVIRLRELELKLARFKRMLRFAGIGLLVACAAGFLVQRELRFRDQERQRTLGTLIGASVRALNDGDYSRALRDTANVLSLLPSGEAETLNRWRYSTTLGQMPKLTLLQALDSQVRWCDFTPDASAFLVGLADGRCQLRDSSSGSVLAEFPGHTNSVNLVVASRDGRWLVSAGEDGTARLWEISGSQSHSTLNHRRAVTAADFHPNGRWVATGAADGVVRIWDIASGDMVREMAAHSQRIEALRFSHSGALMATGGRDKNARLWRVEEAAPLGDPIKHDNWVFSVSFSPDDRRLVTACADHAAYVWLVDSGRLALPPLRHQRGVRHAEFSPDGSAIATAGWDDVLGIWDSITGDLEPPFLRHSSPLSCVRFSAEANRLIAGCTDGTIRIWDRAGRQAAQRVIAQQVSADGSTLLRRAGDTVEILSVGQEGVRSRIKAASLKDAFVDAKGRLVGTIETNAEPGRALRIWDAHRELPLSPLIPLTSLSSRNYFDPTGTRIAVMENNSVSIYEIASGKRAFSPVIKDERINAISFSPDGGKFALASREQVEVRSAETGQLLFPPLTHQFKVGAVIFSPDSRRLAVCTSDSQIAARYAQAWDADTGRPSTGKLWHRDGVTAAAWAADSRSLITVSEHGVGQIWSMPGGEPVGQEIIHREQISHVVVRTKPGLALTASRDATARIWDPSSGDPISPAYRFPDSVAKVWFCPDMTRFVAQELGGPIWVQEVDLIGVPSPVLQDLADVLTGRSALHAQTDDFNAARDLAARWEKTRARHPEWFAVRKEDVLAWRRMEAERFRQRKHHAFELFHVNEIIRADPANTNAVLHKKRLEELLRKEGAKN